MAFNFSCGCFLQILFVLTLDFGFRLRTSRSLCLHKNSLRTSSISPSYHPNLHTSHLLLLCSALIYMKFLLHFALEQLMNFSLLLLLQLHHCLISDFLHSSLQNNACLLEHTKLLLLALIPDFFFPFDFKLKQAQSPSVRID